MTHGPFETKTRASPMHRARRNGDRATAIALLSFLCIGTGLGAVHEARNAHHYCAQHRALEESPVVPALEGMQGASVVPGPERPVLSSRLVASHEACPLTHALGPQVEPSLRPDHRLALLARDARMPGPPRAGGHEPPRILSFAPKTSPPIVA